MICQCQFSLSWSVFPKKGEVAEDSGFLTLSVKQSESPKLYPRSLAFPFTPIYSCVRHQRLGRADH